VFDRHTCFKTQRGSALSRPKLRQPSLDKDSSKHKSQHIQLRVRFPKFLLLIHCIVPDTGSITVTAYIIYILLSLHIPFPPMPPRKRKAVDLVAGSTAPQASPTPRPPVIQSQSQSQ